MFSVDKPINGITSDNMAIYKCSKRIFGQEKEKKEQEEQMKKKNTLALTSSLVIRITMFKLYSPPAPQQQKV